MVTTLSKPAHALPESVGDLFRELYLDGFPRVATFVKMMKGTLEDAQDIFHDALVIYYEKKIYEGLRVQSEPAYLLGIAKHLWLRKYKSMSRQVPMDAVERQMEIPQGYFATVDESRLLQLMKTAGERCLRLLRAFYFDEQGVESIVDGFGFSSSHSATVQKYKCLEKMRDVVKEKSMPYESFFE